MKLQITTNGFSLTPAEDAILQRRLRAIERRLSRFDPDLVHLTLVAERGGRAGEFTAQARLVIMERVLAADRNTAPTASVLIDRVFEDLQEGLERFVAQLPGGKVRRRTVA
jgi:hypothetical protein